MKVTDQTGLPMSYYASRFFMVPVWALVLINVVAHVIPSGAMWAVVAAFGGVMLYALMQVWHHSRVRYRYQQMLMIALTAAMPPLLDAVGNSLAI